MYCSTCKQEVYDAQQSKKGVAPPNNEVHLDHHNPKSNGGSGDPSSLRVKWRGCNLEKSNALPAGVAHKP